MSGVRPGSLPLAEAALVALLAFNCVVYALHGETHEALDSIGWFTLLALFWSEKLVGRTGVRAGRTTLRYIRLGAAAAVIAATLAYLQAGAWLDALNSVLWIAIAALLELQVRCARIGRRAFELATAAVYAGLVFVPLAWLVQREWFAAYDATLWLAAFAAVEMELASPGQRSPGRDQA